MKCANHPSRDARIQCSICHKYLCDQCEALLADEKAPMCETCAMRTALSEMGIKRKEKIQIKRVKEREQEVKKKKRVYQRMLIPISLFLVLFIVELFLYFKTSIPKMEEPAISKDPVTLAMIIDQAIKDYSKDNQGGVPGRLEELLGKYINQERLKAGDLSNFTYIKKSPNSYELRLNRQDQDHVPQLTFTEKGIRL